MQTHKEIVYKMWLALGTFQLLLLCGCNGSTQSSDNLLSNTSASASDSGSGGAERSDEPAAASTIPVRISRAFFERSLTGSVKIGDEESQSDVSWQELPPTAPPPKGPVIGDFRDHQGCATYDELGVRLCFNILPDVSNVGVNARELTLTIDSFDDVRFTGASNADGVLKIGFSASAQGAPKSIELTLRQI